MVSIIFQRCLQLVFLGEAWGAALPGAWGSGEDEGGGSAALRAVLDERLSGEMPWSVPCEARARKRGYEASSFGCLVAVTVKMRLVNLS